MSEVNIFFVDLNPTRAAEALVDKHVVKMVLESTQMLANAYYHEKATCPPPSTMSGTPYQKVHWDHPSAIWVREDFKHWVWLKMHAFELARQYTVRFPNALLKEHACLKALQYMEKNSPIGWLGNRNFTQPPQCMPPEFKVRGDSVAAYRAYYRIGKKELHAWTSVPPPEWIVPRRKTMRELAEELIEKAELVIDQPSQHMPEGIDDNEWEKVVDLATEIINGRA